MVTHTKKAKKPTSSTPKAASSPRSPARIDLSELGALLSSLPAPSETQRGAFRAQFSDARCANLGATTRAATVETEALRFARTAATTLLGPGGASVRYTPTRLAWLGECLAELAARRSSDVEARTDASGRKSSRSVLEIKARAVGSDLSLALQDVSEGNDTLRNELRDARAKVTPADDVLGLLDGHCAVLAAWLQGSEVLRALLESARLDEGTLSAARDAAEALRRERTRANTGANPEFDGPAVNVIEGRVLYEMRLLRKVFNRARERSGDRTIPALTPAPALQRIFLTVDREESVPAEPAPAPEA